MPQYECDCYTYVTTIVVEAEDEQEARDVAEEEAGRELLDWDCECREV